MRLKPNYSHTGLPRSVSERLKTPLAIPICTVPYQSNTNPYSNFLSRVHSTATSDRENSVYISGLDCVRYYPEIYFYNLCNKIWVMSLVLGVLTVGLLFVGYQNHRNGLFSAVKTRLWSGEFFSEKWAFSMWKGTKRFNSTETPTFLVCNFLRAVVGTHRIPKMCYSILVIWVKNGYLRVILMSHFA